VKCALASRYVHFASKLKLSDDEWRRRLSPEEFDVLRGGATEEPYCGEYLDTETPGSYQCRACGADVFCSTTKFNPDTGFPSFFDAARSDAVILRGLTSLRIQVRATDQRGDQKATRDYRVRSCARHIPPDRTIKYTIGIHSCSGQCP
jgi:hypothetical protein